ncbi:hypothetical protein D0Z07_7569 [Hyphodiscus hymeniophilus]|uniref:3-carboxymuconate cyclase n=1 Tax=Hyphodiscus hymeniophilus TaxID=353542 RepID=A0A9P7AU93_9HELO|nr:hypothetical protein D0Z07_7569 [Hyphodiscus hymeniophilus]
MSLALASPTLFPRTIYFLNNEVSGNYLVSMKLSEQDGTVSGGVKIPTGGKGFSGDIAPSADSVVVAGNYLFVPNSGDDTLSFFIINPLDPLHPRLVGRPAPTLGRTPLSVAYSDKHNTACVLNAGSLAGITCYEVSPFEGLKVLGPMRVIPQTENQDPSPAPAGPLILANDIRFNPSESAVFATVRSNGLNPGLLYSFPVSRGQVGTKPVVSSLANTQIAFSLTFLSADDRLLITNPHIGSSALSIVDLSPSGEVVKTQDVTIPREAATCWVAYEPSLKSAILSDAITPAFTVLNTETGAVRGQVNFTTPLNGAMDNKIDRDWFYALTDPFGADGLVASPELLVFDITPIARGGVPKQVQTYDIFHAIGNITNLNGLAIYPGNRL